jgi:hypothetical protein
MTELISEAEARGRGLKFIQGIYYHGKVTIDRAKLVHTGTFPLYQLEGMIKVHSRNTLGRLIATDAPYTFKMQVHGSDGSILNYEVR